jgi:hypothetical protein
MLRVIVNLIIFSLIGLVYSQENAIIDHPQEILGFSNQSTIELRNGGTLYYKANCGKT